MSHTGSLASVRKDTKFQSNDKKHLRSLLRRAKYIRKATSMTLFRVHHSGNLIRLRGKFSGLRFLHLLLSPLEVNERYHLGSLCSSNSLIYAQTTTRYPSEHRPNTLTLFSHLLDLGVGIYFHCFSRKIMNEVVQNGPTAPDGQVADTKVERVLVTGASGYIACHVVKQLLESGKYIVRGTVRNLKNDKKVQPLKNFCPDSRYPLELAEAELLDEHCWERAVVGCKYVIHMASPFPAFSPRDESELIEPAVEGTINVLQACSKANVKRVVLTSSIAAIVHSNMDSKRELTEEDWSVEEHCSPYEKSKLMAERAAWDFVKNLTDDKKFELVVINPGLVYGPVLHGSNCTSMEIPKRLLERQIPMVPRLHFGVVDVRDLAKAHITALTSDKGPGNRYIAVNRGMWVKDTAKILNDEFRPQGYRVPTAVCPSVGMYVYSIFDSSVRMILPDLGKEMSLSNKKIKDDLGFDPIDLEKTVIDMAYSMIEQGFVKKTAKYLGPPEKRAQSTDTSIP